MTNRPPTGLFRRLLFLWRRLRCRHTHVVFWYPKDFFTFERVKDEWEVPEGFVTMLHCVDCGETWGAFSVVPMRATPSQEDPS